MRPNLKIVAPCRMFTETALSFSTGLLNAFVDLISFSGILYTIYPPLFVALLVYSVGGTAISLRLGRPLVGLNFKQEAREADFRSVLPASCSSRMTTAEPDLSFSYLRSAEVLDKYSEFPHIGQGIQTFTEHGSPLWVNWKSRCN